MNKIMAGQTDSVDFIHLQNCQEKPYFLNRRLFNGGIYEN
jgi:hypothetical protein